MDTKPGLTKCATPRNLKVQTIQELYEERAVMDFKDTFINLRKKRGWTQAVVAEKIGISVGQIKKYEKGDSAPTLNILAKIATVFEVSADDFVFGQGKTVAPDRLDHELLKRFEKVRDLPDRERDAVLVLIDSVIARQTIREAIG